MKNRKFSEIIGDLDRHIVSDHMTLTKAGRAYRKDDGIYTDLVNIALIDEDERMHGALVSQFRNQAADKGLYFGVAGFVNLSHIAALRPPAALLSDINAAQTIFWRDLINQFEQTADPHRIKDFIIAEQDGFLERLKHKFGNVAQRQRQTITTKLLDGGQVYRESSFTKTNLPDWLDRRDRETPELSWLEREDCEFLHRMASDGNLAAMTLDISDPASCAALGDGLRAAGLPPVSTFYGSNVLYFLANNFDWAERGLEQKNICDVRAALEHFVESSARIITDRPEADPPLSWPIYMRPV